MHRRIDKEPPPYAQKVLQKQKIEETGGKWKMCEEKYCG